MTPGFSKSLRLDGPAIGLSFACLLHCVGLPLVIALLPAAASWLDVPETFHLFAFALALPASAVALSAGYRHHGAKAPMAFGIAGLLLLGVGALGGVSEFVETGATLAGGGLLILGHIGNWRLRRCSATPLQITD